MPMMPPKRTAHTGEPLPVCPYCGDRMAEDDALGLSPKLCSGQECAVDCAACGREYKVSHRVTIVYDTKYIKAERDNIKRRLIKALRAEAAKCGDESIAKYLRGVAGEVALGAKKWTTAARELKDYNIDLDKILTK